MEVQVPNIGQGLSEVVLISWEVNEGDVVDRGKELAHVESDKSVHVIESPQDGHVAQLLVEVGSIINVGEPICILSEIESIKKKKNLENTPSYVIRPLRSDDFLEIFEIWKKSQSLSTGVSEFSLLENNYAILQKLLFNLSSPFSAWVALRNGHVSGWVGLLPCRNSPLTYMKTGEVSLYVSEPDSAVNPAVLLIKHAINHANENNMSFLIGYTSPQNERVKKLLATSGFQSLGNVGKEKTLLWYLDC